ncbi:general stress protein 26 [Undibacterium sp. GrIS 1.8]|uniref:pyridoxamine 5'-phosphate oxidase family protein n=1 Tax=Undibacterium sp. GrIS 1.8 TaxID=3143934 RepID=UPI00339A25F0
MSSDNSNSIQTLRSKIEHIHFCMMTTINEDMSLSSRPMTAQATDDDGIMWFFVSSNSQLALDLTRHPKTNVSFADPSDNLYIAIAGTVELVKDQAKEKQLWTSQVAAWFPSGLDDPQLSLIKLHIHMAEIWDSKTNKMDMLYQMAKAAITGEHQQNLGEHAKLQF